MLHGISDPVLIHHEPSFVVVSKPAGLLSVPGRGDHLRDCVATRVQAWFADALVVHRLDMATSGVMVMARGLAAQRALGTAFARRLVDKRYVALVAGLLALDKGSIDLPLAADWPRRPMQKVDTDRGRPSLTQWCVLSRDGPGHATLLELTPVTGRSHQLRVHLAAMGHPIIGDPLYAPRGPIAPRLMLHATRLSLPHPLHEGTVTFVSDSPFSVDGRANTSAHSPAAAERHTLLRTGS